MKRVIFFICFAVVLLAGLFIYQYYHFHDGKLHVVFCDVGQGDGILITTPNNKHLMIDAGPDRKIVDCLSRHMAFWERTIDVALLTHPHADHFMGYYYVIDRYRIDQFVTEWLVNKTAGFEGVIKMIDKKKVVKQIVYRGDRWVIPVIASVAKQSQERDRHGSPRDDEVIISIVGPTKEFVERKNPDGIITDSAESASLITQVTYGNFSALLTGDAPVDEVQEVAEAGDVSGLDVLQIPHHGSNTGIDGQVLDLLAPHLAVISVGKNRYGHPTPQTLKLLQERGIKVLRTDQRGDIEIITDGEAWQIQE